MRPQQHHDQLAGMGRRGRLGLPGRHATFCVALHSWNAGSRACLPLRMVLKHTEKEYLTCIKEDGAAARYLKVQDKDAGLAPRDGSR